jgi:hypothetical protein
MSYFDQQYPGQTSLSGSCCAACSKGAPTCSGGAGSGVTATMGDVFGVPTAYLLIGGLALAYLLTRKR